MATIEVGARAAVYDTRGTGVPLVFIHQVATDRRIWRRQLADLADQYHTVAVDILGHGELAWPLEEMSIGRAAVHMRRFLEQVLPGRAFLVGVSMGAAVAMQCALMAPALVRGLILISPWLRISEDTKSLIDRLFRLAEAGDMAGHTDLFLRCVFPPTQLEQHSPEVERVRAIVMEQDNRVVAYAWAACLASGVDGDLSQIHIPSLVITGINDLLTPPYLARELAAQLVDVELEIWNASGHFPFLEHASRFNQRLETYVRRQSAQALSE